MQIQFSLLKINQKRLSMKPTISINLKQKPRKTEKVAKTSLLGKRPKRQPSITVADLSDTSPTTIKVNLSTKKTVK